MKKRLNNYGLWVAFTALLCMILQDTVMNFDIGRYNMYVDSFLGILIAAGIISDPRAGKWFHDKDEFGK